MTPSSVSSEHGRGTARIVLLDFDNQHATALTERLRSHNLSVDVYVDPEAAIAQLRENDSEYEVVIINVSSRSVPWLKTLQKLDQACRRSGVRKQPLVLCVSRVQQQPELVLQIERTGARYVRER